MCLVWIQPLYPFLRHYCDWVFDLKPGTVYNHSNGYHYSHHASAHAPEHDMEMPMRGNSFFDIHQSLGFARITPLSQLVVGLVSLMMPFNPSRLAASVLVYQLWGAHAYSLAFLVFLTDHFVNLVTVLDMHHGSSEYSYTTRGDYVTATISCSEERTTFLPLHRLYPVLPTSLFKWIAFLSILSDAGVHSQVTHHLLPSLPSAYVPEALVVLYRAYPKDFCKKPSCGLYAQLSFIFNNQITAEYLRELAQGVHTDSDVKSLSDQRESS